MFKAAPYRVRDGEAENDAVDRLPYVAEVQQRPQAEEDERGNDADPPLPADLGGEGDFEWRDLVVLQVDVVHLPLPNHVPACIATAQRPCS